MTIFEYEDYYPAGLMMTYIKTASRKKRIVKRKPRGQEKCFFIVPFAFWISKNLTSAVAVTFIFSAFALLLLANHAYLLNPSAIATTHTMAILTISV